jgi:hypothetical protein
LSNLVIKSLVETNTITQLLNNLITFLQKKNVCDFVV